MASSLAADMAAPRPAAVPECTSMTSVLAVKDHPIERRCSSPLCHVHEDDNLGPFVYKFSDEPEFVKTIKGKDYLMKPLYKKLLDPYGFTRPVPRPPPPCWFCSSADCPPEIRCQAKKKWHQRKAVRYEKLKKKYGWKP